MKRSLTFDIDQKTKEYEFIDTRVINGGEGMKTKMPKPVAYRWRVPIINSSGTMKGESNWKYDATRNALPWWTYDGLITTDQAEAYADERVREVLESQPATPSDAEKLLADLVKACPAHLNCEAFHHAKADQHCGIDACGPSERYHAALDAARRRIEGE